VILRHPLETEIAHDTLAIGAAATLAGADDHVHDSRSFAIDCLRVHGASSTDCASDWAIAPLIALANDCSAVRAAASSAPGT